MTTAVATDAPTFRAHATSALAPSLAVGGVAAAVQAGAVSPFLGRYGWDRDELYFLSAAHRPTWGYVDFPPVIAWLGWIVHALFGNSLVALRLTSLAAMLVATLIVGLIARELGAALPTQAAAALVWALTPYALGAGSLFHPTWLDALCWIALLYVILLGLARQRPRLWLAAGAIAGIGLEAKYTIAVLLLALLTALLATDGRELLRTPWPWLGLGVALALFLPNLVWQAQHGWASIHFAASQNAATAGDTSPPTFLAEQLLFLGADLVLGAIGVVVLWRRPRLRPLALVPPLVTALFLLERGRAYYPLPADALAVAAGIVGLTSWLQERRRRAFALVPLLGLHAVTLALALPIVLPIRSTASMISSGVWKQSFYKDEIGWPELASQTAEAWRTLTPTERANGAIVAANYGEASALELYGAARGLPPVLSGHLSWQYWRPRSLPQRFVLFIGYPRTTLAALCRSWEPLARIDNRWQLDNEERGRIIAACNLKRPLGAIWQTSIATDSL